MPVPNLIHPIPVKIEQIDRAGSFVDDDAREPIQFAKRNPVKTVKAQVKWDFELGLTMTKGGAQEGASGYALFRYVDLEAQGIELQQNDRFIEMGGLKTDVYITRLQPTATYDDIGGPTMVKAFFADRQPSRSGER